jgi:hypothetical protein
VRIRTTGANVLPPSAGDAVRRLLELIEAEQSTVTVIGPTAARVASGPSARARTAS